MPGCEKPGPDTGDTAVNNDRVAKMQVETVTIADAPNSDIFNHVLNNGGWQRCRSLGQYGNPITKPGRDELSQSEDLLHLLDAFLDGILPQRVVHQIFVRDL